jgi:hypothetical protein
VHRARIEVDTPGAGSPPSVPSWERDGLRVRSVRCCSVAGLRLAEGTSVGLPGMSSTAYEYTPSANGSVDRRTSSSQRRARQQDAYRVFPRDPHALGVGTARLRRHPHTELHTHVELVLSLGNGKDAALGNGKDVVSDGE